jgi:hypothetical protein
MRSIVFKTYDPAIPIVAVEVPTIGMRGTSPRMTLEQEDKQ